MPSSQSSNSDNPHCHEYFFDQLAKSLKDQCWVKLLLSKYRGDEQGLQRVTIRPIILRDKAMLSFVYQYKTRDITKNLDLEAGLTLIHRLLMSDFKSAHLLTHDEEIQFEVSKKGKVRVHSHAHQQQSEPSTHNREKKRWLDINRPFLTALGVTDKQRQLIPAMSRKWKQINKFIEVFSQALDKSPLSKNDQIEVVDFGSGKGYLTFALHDYLRNSLQLKAAVTGVELREELATLCNNTAAQLEHTGLSFVCGDVRTHAPAHIDVMIALHACDTATDYAIHYGIRANASIIMCSPCCHKQIRPQMHSPLVLQPLLQYGVHLGQEAEMVTDTLRALLLEAHGYTTKVFEFISLEHTNKNKMILAVKNKSAGDPQVVVAQIEALKAFYNIEEHCLQKLLQASEQSA
ncbi:MAG: SAM-dependent methyltransferase [Spongiibacteraceae bacterium]|jgi:hypothetical protein